MARSQLRSKVRKFKEASRQWKWSYHERGHDSYVLLQYRSTSQRLILQAVVSARLEAL